MSGFEVQKTPCNTCIYRRDSPLDLKKLESEIADGRGGFKSFRCCHHSDSACCRGFWNRHKDNFTLGQIAQRLNFVVEVKHDKFQKIYTNANPPAKK